MGNVIHVSGVIVSSQVSQYQVKYVLVPYDNICQVSSDSMLIARCHISGVRYQVSSDNMSSTGVRYQMSSIVWQVPVLDIMCQI